MQLDKLKLWNYIALCGSNYQYQKNGNRKLFKFYTNLLFNLWCKFTDEEKAWLHMNAFSNPDAWSNSVERTLEIIELIKKIGQPVEEYVTLTQQLELDFYK